MCRHGGYGRQDFAIGKYLVIVLRLGIKYLCVCVCVCACVSTRVRQRARAREKREEVKECCSYAQDNVVQEDDDEFSNFDGPSVLVLNPKAAGAGLNITAATVVIHFTPYWNPALEMQASARAHRRGQTMPVMVYRLYYKGTVEETMIDRSKWKREMGDLAVPLSSRENEDINNALNISPLGVKND